MAKVVSSKDLPKALSNALDNLTELGAKKAERVYRESAIDLYSDIIVGTVVDEGRLRGNWFITTETPSKKTNKKADKTKGEAYVRNRVPVSIFGKKLYMTNNLPYAVVVEFGGYPKTVKKGTKNKQTGKFEKRSSGGYSRLAPQGMVRVNMVRFPAILKRNITKVA